MRFGLAALDGEWPLMLRQAGPQNLENHLGWVPSENNKGGILERLHTQPKFKVQRLHKKPIQGLKYQKAVARQGWRRAVCRAIPVMQSGSCSWPLRISRHVSWPQRFSMRDLGDTGKHLGVSKLLCRGGSSQDTPAVVLCEFSIYEVQSFKSLIYVLHWC